MTACDFDEDGDLDVYVSNYRLQNNLFWLNNGQGVFTNGAAELYALLDPDTHGSPEALCTDEGGSLYVACQGPVARPNGMGVYRFDGHPLKSVTGIVIPKAAPGSYLILR